MEEIKVNKKTLKYVGKPLETSVFDGKYWSGLTNFLCYNEKIKTTVDIIDLKDCFSHIRNWSLVDPKYICGYVLDYTTKTIYYDKQQALDYLLKKAFVSRKEEGYFENFVQKDFKI